MTRMTMMVSALLLLAGCANTLDKLENVGKPPPMTEIENPHTSPEYKPMTWPLPNPQAERQQFANSLWQPGSRAFFRDQRAGRVGDILKVKVEINDRAALDNETTRSRSNSQNITNPTLAGLERIIMPESTPLLALSGNSDTEGTGEIERTERIETEVAAVITQVLPNGNFVISGTQEIRVNSEVRELSVQGIIRPQDVDSNNTIDSSQIAEARINYGGRGNVSDMQAPRWGHQVIDIIAPF